MPTVRAGHRSIRDRARRPLVGALSSIPHGRKLLMRSLIVALMLSSAALALLAGAATGERRQVPVVRLHAMTTVSAPAPAVWAWLTTGKNLATWCPSWKAPANARITLTRIGDVIEFTDDCGHGGRSVVTYFDRNRELRVAHEPTKGDYMCQSRVVLEPAGGGTTVHLWEQYTDESSAPDMHATADKVEGELNGSLAAMKRALESR
jgi:uncharacterized protein YndB with AHSA1/START domain